MERDQERFYENELEPREENAVATGAAPLSADLPAPTYR